MTELTLIALVLISFTTPDILSTFWMMDEDTLSQTDEQEIGKEIEKNIEQNVENFVREKAEKFMPPIIEVFVMIVVNVVFLIILNFYRDVIPFLSQDFDQVLPVFNLVMSLNIIMSLARIPFLTSQKVKFATQTISNIASLYISYQLWIVFPFDNSWANNPGMWDSIFRWIIGITAFLTALSTVVEGGKMLAGNPDES